MKIHSTPLPQVFHIETQRLGDQRGSFARFFCEQELRSVLKERKLQQINHSYSYETGTIRGMHFQYPPYAEMKLIRCLRGVVFDVALDLRYQSSTFLHWYGIELEAEKDNMLVIPEGVAHGFQTLTPNVELLYLHTAMYTPEYEGGIRFDDPEIAIDWPLPATTCSERDTKHPLISQGFNGIVL